MLEDAFSFTAAELELNRSGKLSADQEARLEQFREMRGCGRRAAVIAFGLTAAGMFAVPLVLANEPGMGQARPYIWGVAGFIVAIMLIFSLVELFAGQKMAKGEISTMQGVVETWSKEIGARSSKVGTAYFMNVDFKKYQLTTEAQMEALEDDQSYRFYYIENGRVPIIFSVEQID